MTDLADVVGRRTLVLAYSQASKMAGHLAYIKKKKRRGREETNTMRELFSPPSPFHLFLC